MKKNFAKSSWLCGATKKLLENKSSFPKVAFFFLLFLLHYKYFESTEILDAGEKISFAQNETLLLFY